MTTPTPDPLADPVTLAAYEALSGAETRSTFVRCPECGDYVTHDYIPVLAHAETCAPLRQVAADAEQKAVLDRAIKVTP